MQSNTTSDLLFTPSRPPKGLAWPVLFLLTGFAFLGGAIADPSEARIAFLFFAVVFGIPAFVLLWRRQGNPRRRAWQLFGEARALLTKDLGKAATLAETAVQIDDNLNEAKFIAGIAFHDLDEHEKAAMYLGAINCGTSRTFAPTFAHSLYRLGRLDEAVEVLQRHPYGLDADETDEKDFWGVTLLGGAFAAKGDHRTAIEVYERLTRKRRMSPEMAALRHAYAQSLASLGNGKRAIRELRKVLAFDADFPDAKELVAELESKLTSQSEEDDDSDDAPSAD